jgi:hypothetical protein
MYKVTFLSRIETKDDEGKKVFHSATYSDSEVTKAAKNFASLGVLAVHSVEVLKSRIGKSKLSEKQVIDLFYPEMSDAPLSDEDKKRKEKAIANSKSKEKADESEEDRLRSKAKSLKVRSWHVLSIEKLKEEIAKAEAEE